MQVSKEPRSVDKLMRGTSKADSRRRQLVFDLERHPFEVMPLTQLYIILTKRKTSWWTALENEQKNEGQGANDDEPEKPAIVIPETVVWENNIPKGWFIYDNKDKCVMRRKVETQHIQQSFLKGAQYENDVVAVTYAMPLSGEKDEIQYRFLTAAQLPAFLFENRRGKGTSILQKFVFPLAVTHNDMIQAVWTPAVVQVSRRQNTNPVFDERVDVNERCATFEGSTHASQSMHVTSRLKAQIEDVCNALVSHFRETDPKYAVSRLNLFFKMSDTSELRLLFCSSARVLSTNVYESSSFLHKKFRVSLELATRFMLRDSEDDMAKEVDEIRKAKLREKDSNAHTLTSQPSFIGGGRGGKRSSLLLALGTPSQRDSAVDLLEAHREAERQLLLQQYESKGKGKKAATPDPSVGRAEVKASRLGFVVRPESAASRPSATSHSRSTPSECSPSHSHSRVSVVSPPARAERRRVVGSSADRSRRSTASGGQSVQNVVLDALKTSRNADVAEELRNRQRRLLERTVDKAGHHAVRSAYLTIREGNLDKSPFSGGLYDHERMELLSLKLREHRIRKGELDTDSGRVATPSKSPQRVDVPGNEFIVPTCSSPEAKNRSLSTTVHDRHVIDGVSTNAKALQDRLLDHLYVCQSHFEVPNAPAFTLVLMPNHPADQLLLDELRRREDSRQKTPAVDERGTQEPALSSNAAFAKLKAAAAAKPKIQDSGEFVIDDDTSVSNPAVAYAVRIPGAALKFEMSRVMPPTGGDQWTIEVEIHPQPRAAQLLHHIIVEALKGDGAGRAAALMATFEPPKPVPAPLEQQSKPRSAEQPPAEEEVPKTPDQRKPSASSDEQQEAPASLSPAALLDVGRPPTHSRQTSGASSGTGYSDDFED